MHAFGLIFILWKEPTQVETYGFHPVRFKTFKELINKLINLYAAL